MHVCIYEIKSVYVYVSFMFQNITIGNHTIYGYSKVDTSSVLMKIYEFTPNYIQTNATSFTRWQMITLKIKNLFLEMRYVNF